MKKIELVRKALDYLSLEGRTLIKMRFGLNQEQENNTPKTQEECGLVFKITRQGVKERERTLIKKLRKYLQKEQFKGPVYKGFKLL